MAARNTPESFGWVTRALHWAIAAGALAMLGLGSYIARMEVSLSNLWLFGFHKSLGLVLLSLALLRIAWHRFSPPPRPLEDGIAWHAALARGVHRLFYLLLLALPVSGWIASAATGIDTVVFGRWTLPRIAPVSERLELVGFALHGGLAACLALLLGLHILGAFHRRDGTLRRMIFGEPGLSNSASGDQGPADRTGSPSDRP